MGWKPMPLRFTPCRPFDFLRSHLNGERWTAVRSAVPWRSHLGLRQSCCRFGVGQPCCRGWSADLFPKLRNQASRKSGQSSKGLAQTASLAGVGRNSFRPEALPDGLRGRNEFRPTDCDADLGPVGTLGRRRAEFIPPRSTGGWVPERAGRPRSERKQRRRQGHAQRRTLPASTFPPSSTDLSNRKPPIYARRRWRYRTATGLAWD